MKELDLAYMAGIFDGEGCIMITRDSRYNTHSLQCAFIMTCEYIPNLFQYYFGGNVSFRDMAEENPNWKPEWRWTICARKASAFLETISPYLRLKKAEAELGIAFQGRKRLTCANRTEEEKAVDEAQYILMRNLKKGGAKDEKTNTF